LAVSYEELEPYYAKAEEMYHVHGLRGRDPTEPPASGPYPCPPVSNEPRIQELFEQLKAAGCRPFPAPCAIMLDERNMPYSTCIRCQTCDGFPCLVHAKSDAEVVAVRPALEFPNVTLLRNAKAVKLETNAAGTAVTEVIAEVAGEREVFRGDIVVVSCGAVNSAKLLLISRNEKHPDGLANGSDQVGRNYMFHNSQAVLAISREPNPTMFQKTIALNDFYFGMDGFEYPMGNIQMTGKSLGPMYRGEKPLETALLPLGLLDDLARHAVDFWLTTEDLPDPDNRVTVDASGMVTLSYTPNNQVPQQKLYAKLKSMLSHLGMHPEHLIPRNIYMKTAIPIAGCAHQAGTCRFGTNPKTSVLNTNCKAHELDNLYVVDTSFFVSIGAVNPSLTAIANAIRVGDHLLQRLA
jgi:choline dehydrogenase-like flavoprotein